MNKKEFYRHILPHFQQPGQAYFVTWSLKDAIPPKALAEYTQQLEICNSNLQNAIAKKEDAFIISNLKMQHLAIRQKYFKAYDDVLHLPSSSVIDLSKPENTKSVLSALNFWNGKRLENYAICIMNNHVHWVFRLYTTNELGQAVYLQDILQSVKRFSANQLNQNEGRKGAVWQKESWDTTIRDFNHLFRVIEYSINNPVKAGLVKDWKLWRGTQIGQI